MLILKHKRWLKVEALLPKVPKRYFYLVQLFGITTLFHALFFVLLCANWFKTQQSMHIILNRRIDSAQIVLLPMIKQVSGALFAKDDRNAMQQVKKSAVGKVHKVNETKKELTAKKEKAGFQAKKAQPRAILNTKEQKKEQPQKRMIEKESVKKVEKKAVIKKEKPKPTLPMQHNEVINKSLADTQKQNTQTDLSNAPEPIFLGRDDLLLLNCYETIQSEIERVWQPPVGLSPDLSCTLTVKLDMNGMVQDVQVAESSSVLAYDAVARSAIMNVSFPHPVWGKSILITFKR